jgi:hypothetical protein
VSKVKTLHKAIEYIKQLQDLLMHGDHTQTLVSHATTFGVLITEVGRG